MYSLLDFTLLVTCSKSTLNPFARFDPNRFRFVKWNTPLLGKRGRIVTVIVSTVRNARADIADTPCFQFQMMVK